MNPSTPSKQLHIGIMSGTSMDGIDGVLAAFDASGKPELLGYATYPFTTELKDALMSLQSPGENEVHREALAANALAMAYTEVVAQLIEQCNMKPQDIMSIGAHGQTIRHQPGLGDGIGYTKQTLSSALLAERTGIDVIADFRSRDIAAQGQGAPLVPAFHAAQFGSSNTSRAILNIGGIANLTLLDPNHSEQVRGFDCGPGNVLMDLWFARHHGQAFDQNGDFARSGELIPELLHALLSEPFLKITPPKSTGRDLFNASWLDQILTDLDHSLALEAKDVQKTLTHFTAISAMEHLKKFSSNCSELLICGGGIQNSYLIEVIQALATEHFNDLKVCSTADFGIDPQLVEALAFAWLAWAHINHKPANLPAVTGAKGPRILGARYPA